MNTLAFQIIDIVLMLTALALIGYGFITNRKAAITAPDSVTETVVKKPRLAPYPALAVGAALLVITVLMFQPGVLMGVE